MRGSLVHCIEAAGRHLRYFQKSEFSKTNIECPTRNIEFRSWEISFDESADRFNKPFKLWQIGGFKPSAREYRILRIGSRQPSTGDSQPRTILPGSDIRCQVSYFQKDLTWSHRDKNQFMSAQAIPHFTKNPASAANQLALFVLNQKFSSPCLCVRIFRNLFCGISNMYSKSIFASG